MEQNMASDNLSSEHETGSHEQHEEKRDEKMTRSDMLSAFTPKASFIFGIAVGASVISTLGFLSLLSFQGNYLKNITSGTQNVLAANDKAVVVKNDDPSPTPSPTPNPSQPGGTEESNDPSKITITDQDHIRGDKNAPITLVEFSDFQCPYCQRFHSEAQKLIDNNPGKVRWVLKHFPLSFHEYANKAAESAECAGEQGKFWEYADKLFLEQDKFSNPSFFSDAASQLGLDRTQFDNCVTSGKYKQKIQADYDMGVAAGVSGTPGSFINGVYVAGAKPYASLQQIVDGLK